MLILLLLLISLAFLIRTVLITIGLLKGPVLQTFEKYGDDETIYHPMPALLLWTGMLLITVSPVIAAALDAAVLPLALPGILMLGANYLLVTHPEVAREHPNIFLIYPRWYHELRSRTSRYERRRIAYKWLWLPPRLRLVYNTNDRAFSQWADLVIMATMDIDEGPDAPHNIPASHY